MTQDLTDDEIQNIIDDVKDAYGVEDDDVTVDVTYDVEGTLDITIPDDVDQTELERFLEEQLADILGVPVSDVDVDVTTDPITYVISNDSYDGATDVQNQMNDPATVEELNRRLEEAFPGTVVDSVDVNDDIKADVDVTVDTTDSDVDPENAGNTIEDSQGNDGWNVDTTGNFLFSFLQTKCF